MFITKSYRYMKGGIEYVSGILPEDATLTEIMDILNAEEGYDLIRIADNENMSSSLWLKSDDSQENYREQLIKSDE